ncbi:MAG TPA: TetR/AcrR family transcriptional regulator [Microbacteriaceae bacterium]|nr:TetR/AcrR family transcriptional regulator [Microbacteriaceae bacterium]
MTIESRAGARARRDIIDAALSAFAQDGFSATSVQHIADAADTSKSGVLYHFDSKERMLDAAITPALDALETILNGLPPRLTSAALEDVIVAFVDFLLAHRREAAIVLIQGRSLASVPVMSRANQLVADLAEAIEAAAPNPSVKLRVGVGLAGTAYVLATGDAYAPDLTPQPDDEVRATLIGVLSDLFARET